MSPSRESIYDLILLFHNCAMQMKKAVTLKSYNLFMSPFSPEFHTEVTVRIGLKTHLEWEHPFHKIRCNLHPSMLLRLIIWEWLRVHYSGTDQEPSIYLSYVI